MPPNHRRTHDRRQFRRELEGHSLRGRGHVARARQLAVVGAAIALAGCGGEPSHTTTTVTSMLPAETKTVTVTFTPPPPPGPKTSIESDGTFAVNSDIAPGTYHTPGKYGCYWARLRSFDTNDIIDNNVSDGPQVVQIFPGDKAFLTRNCAQWQKVG